MKKRMIIVKQKAISTDITAIKMFTKKIIP